jgi:AcrR family transcriptional regulator/acyl-coenzyme A thioesterase PaaI-like protein
MERSRIDVTAFERGRALAELSMRSGDVGIDGSVAESLIVQLTQEATKAGAAIGEPNHQAFRVVDMRVDFFALGEGDHLYASALLIHDDGVIAVWRTSVYRSTGSRGAKERTLIAETSQTLRRSALVDASPGDVGHTNAVDVQPQGGPVKLRRGRPRKNGDQPSNIAAQRRHQIFEGACDVISRKGYGAATVREIARAANLSIPTMYQHIESKEDILFMITSECMQEIFQSFKNDQSSEESAQLKMEHAITAYVKYVSKNRRYINLIYRETKSLNVENREKIFQIEREFCALWENIIHAGNETGEFDVSNPDLAANIVYFSCNVWALRHWNIGKYDENEVCRSLIRFILPGLRNEQKEDAKISV